jgi:hypothetical protein
MVLVVGMLAVANEDDPQQARLRQVLDGFLALVGLVLIVATAWRLGQHWSSVDHGLLWRALLLRACLTVVSLSFIYGLSLTMGYGSAFSRMDLQTKPRRVRVKPRAAAIFGLGGHLRYVHRLAGAWPTRIGRQTSFTRAYELVGEYKASLRSDVSDAGQ